MFGYLYQKCNDIEDYFRSRVHAINSYAQYHFGIDKGQRCLLKLLYGKIEGQYKDTLIELFKSEDDFVWTISLLRNYVFHEKEAPTDKQGKEAKEKFKELKIDKIANDDKLLEEYSYKLQKLLIICILIELDIPAGKTRVA